MAKAVTDCVKSRSRSGASAVCRTHEVPRHRDLFWRISLSLAETARDLSRECPHECLYCYARTFRSNPGKGRLVFCEDAAKLLDQELARKRKKPEKVYFSTSTDPFPYESNVLAAQLDVMRILLRNGIRLIVFRKARIPAEFIALLTEYRQLVQVQVGLNTLDEQVRCAVEPGAGTVEVRLNNMALLGRAGVPAIFRMDPIIPGLTDNQAQFTGLVFAAATRGARNIIASCLFLRGAHRWPKDLRIGEWSYVEMVKRHYTYKLDDFCSGGSVILPPPEYRQEQYGLLREIAVAAGINVTICGCKNSDVPQECCMSAVRSC